MAMQHAQLDLGHAVVMDALWSSLMPDERRAMRACCKPMRDAVDAQFVSLECPKQPALHNDVLSAAACARLCGVRTMTLRSMRPMRDMLLHPGAFPRLQSLRLLLEDDAVIESAADYQAIASAAPWLTHFSYSLPASATALPQQMASLLAACSKLQDLAILVRYSHAAKLPQTVEGFSFVRGGTSNLADVSALATGTQLLSLRLPSCSNMTNLAPLRALLSLRGLDMSDCEASDVVPLGALMNLQTLKITDCLDLSDLAPLGALLRLQSLDISNCRKMSDLAPLVTMVYLKHLDMYECATVSDLAPLAGMASLQSLNISRSKVSDLTPLAGRVNLQELDINGCDGVSDLAPLAGMMALQRLGINSCHMVSDVAPLRDLANLQHLDMSFSNVADLAPLGDMGNMRHLELCGCSSVSDVAPLGFMVNFRGLDFRCCHDPSCVCVGAINLKRAIPTL
ncbi:hypothetical protein FOA52_008475 [Chlamydomonas sp. UWO 241]|nr:hypothetical protein FOA52_008475 [Chlamydomonas sp. UWO 241]